VRWIAYAKEARYAILQAPLLLALVLAVGCDNADSPSAHRPPSRAPGAPRGRVRDVAPPARTVDVVAGMTVTLVLQGGAPTR
jgi:hypothetical protein